MRWTQHLFLRFNDDWGRAICYFAQRLRESLGDLLVSVVAGPREDFMFHGCNVVVVVREDTVDVRRKVVEAEREAEKQHGWKVGIAPMIVREEEEDELRLFLSTYESDVSAEEWKVAVDDFAQRLRESLGDLLVSVVAGPREDFMFHGCNVVVVVREDTVDV
ncbi:MAG: hypothetical protein QXO59_05125, partial [Candidatus Jordarchaeales archaeon]